MRALLKPISVLTCFGILILVLVAGILMTRRQLAQQMDAQAWVVHTREVIYHLQATEFLLKDAESGQRGFLLTGDDHYLDSYNASVAQIAPHLARLAQLIGENHRLATELTTLRWLAANKTLEMQETIDLYHEGRQEDARKLVLTNWGKTAMDEVRESVASMEAEEQQLDVARNAEYDRSARATVTSLYLVGAVGIAGLCALALFILRAIRLREEYTRSTREQEERFRVTLMSIGDAVIATDHEGKVTFMNPLAERLTGNAADQSEGRPIQEICPITNEVTGMAEESPVKKVMEEGNVLGIANHTILHADGRRIPIQDSAAAILDDRGSLIGVVLVFRDVTSERKSQEVLRRTDKLTAAARLAATVAHEINNPLEAVSNLVYLAKTAPGAPDAVIAHLSLAEDELARVAHITQQTLGFYRETNSPVPMELARIMDSVLELFANKIEAKEIAVDRRYKPCPSIIGTPGEMRQAMANLISNAVDAVGNDGVISVDIHCAQERGEQMAEVAVQDDGPGIPSENLGRIFEPFFTTKRDVGTGLGLYVTRDIVERQGGTLDVLPSGHIGGMHGACFVMRLPCNRPPQNG
jgi:PAS domain S-box-containing protein